MVLEKNIFVERVLPGSVIRRPSEEEMAAYRRPYANPGRPEAHAYMAAHDSEGG